MVYGVVGVGAAVGVLVLKKCIFHFILIDQEEYEVQRKSKYNKNKKIKHHQINLTPTNFNQPACLPTSQHAFNLNK